MIVIFEKDATLRLIFHTSPDGNQQPVLTRRTRPSKEDGPRAGDARRRSRRFQGAANSVCSGLLLAPASVARPSCSRCAAVSRMNPDSLPYPRSHSYRSAAFSVELTRDRAPPSPACRRSAARLKTATLQPGARPRGSLVIGRVVAKPARIPSSLLHMLARAKRSAVL
jgi:hypothetical protein